MNYENLTPEKKAAVNEFLAAFCSDYSRKQDGINFLIEYGWLKNYDPALPAELIEDYAKNYPGNFNRAAFQFYHIMDYTNNPLGQLKNTLEESVFALRNFIQNT